MTSKYEDIRGVIDAALSGIGSDPELFDRVVNAAEGEPSPVRRRLTLSMALVLAAVMLTGTAAFAAVFRGVAYFLTEKNEARTGLDPAYLFDDLDYYHTSSQLDVRVVDAYWDGLELFVACRVEPLETGRILGMVCHDPAHSHDPLRAEADLLLQEPAFISLTDETGDLSEPASYFADWVYESDGAITIMLRFQRFDMSEYVSIGIPLYTTQVSTGDVSRAFLHCVPIRLADPLADHLHDWSPATCQHPKLCRVCGRTEGENGCHDYVLSADGGTVVCGVCGHAMNKPTFVPAGNNLYPGDQDVFVLALQLRLTETGDYTGAFTGLYDDGTTEAVRRYQESHGLEPTGICLADTLQRLFHAE